MKNKFRFPFPPLVHYRRYRFFNCATLFSSISLFASSFPTLPWSQKCIDWCVEWGGCEGANIVVNVLKSHKSSRNERAKVFCFFFLFFSSLPPLPSPSRRWCQRKSLLLLGQARRDDGGEQDESERWSYADNFPTNKHKKCDIEFDFEAKLLGRCNGKKKSSLGTVKSFFLCGGQAEVNHKI